MTQIEGILLFKLESTSMSCHPDVSPRLKLKHLYRELETEIPFSAEIQFHINMWLVHKG